MLRIPYLPGESDMDQLKTIFRALGTPTEEDWPVLLSFTIRATFLLTFSTKGHTKLPDYVPVGQFPKTPLRDLFTAASADTLNLLSKCLIFEPRKRVSAREVCPSLFWTANLTGYCRRYLTLILQACHIPPILPSFPNVPHKHLDDLSMKSTVMLR